MYEMRIEGVRVGVSEDTSGGLLYEIWGLTRFGFNSKMGIAKAFGGNVMEIPIVSCASRTLEAERII